MSKKRCMVIVDFIGSAGILIKKGSVSEVLKEEKDYIWIDPYIEEIGEKIPIPIFRNYVRYF